MKKENNNKYVVYLDDVCEYLTLNKERIADELNINIKDVFFNDACCDAANTCIQDDYFYFIDMLNSFDACVEYSSIYIDGDLGLWYGRKHATRHFRTLKDAICFCFEDVNKVYCNRKNTTLTLQASHHDGCNIFKFYKIVNGRKKAINFFDLLEVL